MGAEQGLETVAGQLDTLLVVGGIGREEAASDEPPLGQVRRLAGLSRRVASVCTGAYVLAAAGLLDHRRVTIHWGGGTTCRASPAVAVDVAPPYIRDGNVYTSAGVTSALDLTLALIEDDHGPTHMCTGRLIRRRSPCSWPLRRRRTGWCGTWWATSPVIWPRTSRPPLWRRGRESALGT
ncbi:DJ-1/PfpI family protein [Streptomyces werraensis]|uniref:DJ-1/PfpI family protein n=1 Tax=Streptomyces werraensis TaxID=68284 RepID=UPI003699A0B7